MKNNIKQHKLTTMALVTLVLVALLTVAIQGLATSGPDADGYMTYTIDTAADECSTDDGGDAFGPPFAKYDLGVGGGFTFDGTNTENDLFIVTHQPNGDDTDTATIQLDPSATTSFTVSFVSAKHQTESCKYLINVTLNPGDSIVGLPAPGNGNFFSHVSVHGAKVPTQTTTPPVTSATTATTGTTATSAATTGTTATSAATIVVTEPNTPLVSVNVTTMTASPTTTAAATMTLPTEEVPLADTGENISWSTIIGIIIMLAGSVIFWKRQVARNSAK